MEPKQDDNQFVISGVSDVERDFGHISSMLRWKETRFFGPSPRNFYNAADFFLEYATQRMKVRLRRADVSLIGYAEFSYYPLLGALPPDCWIHWLKHHFCISKEFPLNWGDTMFFTRFIFNPRYNPTLLQSILTEVFHREFKIRYIVILQMPNDPNLAPEDTPCYDMLHGFTTVLYPRAFSVKNCRNVQRLHIIHRNSVIERMRYRKALPEDNDDIVEVIDVDRPDLREEYGDFYIAEELQKEIDEDDKHNTFIACELQHHTVGFIWLNDDVSILTLVENFECEGFGNMIKYRKDRPYGEKRLIVTGIEKKPPFKLFTSEAVEEIYDLDLERLISTSKNSESSDKTCSRPTCPTTKGDNIISTMRRPEHTSFNYGINETNVKYFVLREEFFRKMELIDMYFRSPEHYQTSFRKRLRIRYNIPEGYNEAEQGEFPFDTYSNVFAIKLLGISEATDTRFASRFIATAFTAHPDRDYCLISIPNKIKISRSVEMLLGFFVTLVPRPGTRIDDTVYIINRSTIFGHMGVMNLLPEDVMVIGRILEKSSAMLNKRASTFTIYGLKQSFFLPPETYAETSLVSEVIEDVFNNPMSEFHFLTIRCGDSMRSMEHNVIVGFVIVRPFFRLQELDYKYVFLHHEVCFKNIPGEIVLLRLHPNYHWESDAIFRQISCATGYWEFYYAASTMTHIKPLTNDLVTQMQPIEPRAIAQVHRHKYNKPKSRASQRLSEQLDSSEENIALYYHNLLPSKTYGNHEPIIIIGFNSLTRALMRMLLFNFQKSNTMNCHCCLPRLRVIVVAKTGLVESAYDSDFECSICENQSDCYVNFENANSFIRDTTRCMDFRKYASFVSSTVKKIKREDKTIVLANGCELYYGQLIFSMSQRFGVPPALQREQLPSNYIHINNRFDKITAYHKLEAILNDQNSNDINIIVFGSRLSAYEFINFLVTHKIPPQAICLVLPYDKHTSKSYLQHNISNMDVNIEMILQGMVEDMGVKVESYWILNKWIYYYLNEKIISHAAFEHYPNGTLMTLPCDLFVSFHAHVIGTEIMDLMENTGIEMEGLSILIDEEFRTTDPYIFAVGNCARLRTEPNHQYKHVAKDEIAAKLLRSLDLTEDLEPEHSEKYLRPVYYQAQLPLGHHMAKVVLPKRYIANHLDNTYLLTLVTYDGNFSRVRINEHGIVVEITCVTNKKRSFDHLQYFVGHHESLLNDLYSRWYLREITSFVDFFEEPWTELIMHRNFDDLRSRIRSTCIDMAKEILDMDLGLDRKTRKQLMKRQMAESGCTDEVEKTLLRFLRKNRDDFIYPFALPEDFHLNISSKLNV